MKDSKKISDNLCQAYIIRHGETEWNKKGIYQGGLDSPLTQKGISDAKKIAKLLKDKNVTIILCSPLQRAKKTANIISKVIKARVVVAPEFKEMNFGIFEGKKKSFARKLYKEFFTKREKNNYFKLYENYPEGESYFDVFLRVNKVLPKILENYENFIIVGHESVNRIIRGIIKKIFLKEMISLRQNNNEVVLIDLNTLGEYIITI